MKMRNIIDTWNMIDKFGIKEYRVLNSVEIELPDSEYERMLNLANNKTYIQNLRRK